MTFHLRSPFTNISIYLIACEAGSVFQEGDCPREIVIFRRSGNVGVEDQVSDTLFLVLYPDLSRGFCCQWKVMRTSLSSLPS